MLDCQPVSLFAKYIRRHRLLAAKALILANTYSGLEVVSNSLVLPLTQILGSSAATNDKATNFLRSIFGFPVDIKSQLIVILLLFMGLTFVKNICLYFSNLSINRFALKGGEFVRHQCIERYLELDIFFYTQTGLGETLSYVNEHTKRLELLFSARLEIVREVISITFLIAFLIFLSPLLTLVTTLSLLTIAFLLKSTIRSVQVNSRKSVESLERFADLITEIISGIRVVKSFNAEQKELVRTHVALDKLFATEMLAYRFNSAVAPLTETAGIAVLLVILMAGTFLLASPNGETLPILLTYTLVLLRTLPRVTHLNGLRSQISLLSASTATIERFLSETARMRLPDGWQPYRGLQQELSFEGLTFSYPNSPQPALDNVSFRIPKGTTTAIVGASGSGKSTAIDLLMRFYDPDRGSIQVDGIDLRDLEVAGWRRSIAIVSQDNFLFNESIRTNIAYGCPDATEAEIVAAAKQAYAYEFIQQLPDGFETIVGSRGGRLSGGQRQRIAIARAIVCDPDLLILDEATSALDSTSEKIVQQAIEAMVRDRTVITIAHRLSTIERSDNIIVLDRGRLVEQGHHQELLKQRGKYWSLYQSQVATTDESLTTT